ncbi:phosphotransferase family protein [Rhodococcus sp. BE178]|uniref:phosphotransferase family protein n=1 Tax=Rhodococcus sp. BE178 TaxID=2817737 RepID=UPI003D1B3134
MSTAESTPVANEAGVIEGRLTLIMSRATQDPSLRVENLRRVPAGASRHTWSFDAYGETTEREELILRIDAPGAFEAESMNRESALMTAAGRARVPSPRVVTSGSGDDELGASYIVMSRVAGESIPRKILRDSEYSSARPRMAGQCGQILARIHSIDPASVAGLEERDELDTWRKTLSDTGRAHPAFELAIRWLDQNRPPAAARRVVHGDFRLGNFIVGPEGIRAVLDWELAHLGDPLEDLGWLCVKTWRFGQQPPVGGFGTVDDLVAAYEAESGSTVDRDALHWWLVLGTLKWGILCLHQAERHLSGATRSVELAAIGRRVSETEWDLLELLP